MTATSAYGSVSFSLTNSAAGIPATITPVSPARQQARRQPLRQPLSVRVLDAGGHPVVGATVTFTLAASGERGASGSGDGSAQVEVEGSWRRGREVRRRQQHRTAQTDSDGVATSPVFTANATGGASPRPRRSQCARPPASSSRTFPPEASRSPASGLAAHRNGRAPYGRRLRVRVREAKGSPRRRDRHLHARLHRGRRGAGMRGRDGRGGELQAAPTRRPRPPAPASRPHRGSPRTAAGSFTATAASTATTSVARFALRNRAGTPARSPPASVPRSRPGRHALRDPARGHRHRRHGNTVPGALVTFTAPAPGRAAPSPGATGRDVTVGTDRRHRRRASRSSRTTRPAATSSPHACLRSPDRVRARQRGAMSDPLPSASRRRGCGPATSRGWRASACARAACAPRSRRSGSRSASPRSSPCSASPPQPGRPARRDQPARHQPARRHHRPELQRPVGPAAARRARHDRPHRPGLRRRLHRHARQRQRATAAR